MARLFFIMLVVGAILGPGAPDAACADMRVATACRSGSVAMMRTELIFGTQRSQRTPVSSAAWQRFVAREISPRFPDGFTVIDAQGGWRGRRGLIREKSYILIVWHESAPQPHDNFEVLRSIYKQRFRQHSVLRIDGSDCVSF